MCYYKEQTVAVGRRLNDSHDYNGQIIARDNRNLKFIICFTVEEKLQRKLPGNWLDISYNGILWNYKKNMFL